MTAEFTARAEQIIAEAQATVARELDDARANEQQIVEGLVDTLLTHAIGRGVPA